ncbi:MAG: pilus assembly protein [Chloroflexi bacterium]|nr:pilus assembly protein [Chloroflexota bacterium]
MVTRPRGLSAANQLHAFSRGQSLLEFALVLSVLMLLVMGLFDLGYAVFINNMLSEAAREGARAGIISANSDAAIRCRVDAAAPGLNPQVTIAPATRTFNNPITVTVTYLYHPMTPIVGNIASSLPLSSTSVMIVEGAQSSPMPAPCN